MADALPARDSFRWAILALITVSHIIGATAQYGINTLAPFYQGELGLSRAQVGLFFSAFYLAMTGASFVAGWLADRLGVRRTTLQGHLAVGLCTVAAALSPSFSWAFASFFLAGLGYSFLNPSSTKGVMAWFYRDERATAMGIKQTGVPAGGVVAAVLAAPLVLVVGWRGALAALGAANFLFGFVFSWLWRDPREESQTVAGDAGGSSGRGAPLEVWGFVPASFGTAIFLIGQMSLITYVPLYLKDEMGFSAYWASQALAILQSGAMVGRIGWGVASDRLFGGRRKIVLMIIGLLGAVLTAGLSVATPETPLAVLLALVFFSGLCLVGYQGVSYALIGELAGTMRAGVAMGVMITINAAAAAVGTPLIGYLVDRTGSYAVAWQALAGATLFGIAGLGLFLKEPRRRAPVHAPAETRRA
ncbi:MAG TPA: MFS transporter [candidate division Zixibacteria bacterium]|nr:MFS transporter [candidate division Zixibacteria bacterium]